MQDHTSNILKDNMNGLQKSVKRFFDVTISCVSIVLLLPLYLLIFIILKCSSHGKVIFSQQRIGYKGQPFIIYKFRTLSSEIEDDGPQLISTTANCDSTPFERLLRKSHLDELPQLWNVIKGEMSIVGPRPERKYFIDKIMNEDARYEYIYLMRPGLTSRATIENGYTDTMEKMLRRLEMDLEYLQTRTLRIDAVIILKTIGTILKNLISNTK